MRRRKRRKQRKMILISSLTLLFIITVGYAAFQTNINITAKGNILEKGITINELKNKVTTSGDGLYVNTYEEGRYVYKGANPDNYITFNNETWRIIAIESDNTLKIIKKDNIGALAWDSDGDTDWAKPATLNTYLNETFYNKINDKDRSLIVEHDFGIGPVSVSDSNMIKHLESENSIKWNGHIGLMSASEIIMANSNIEQCGNFKINYDNREVCKITNYMIPKSGLFWTITLNNDSSFPVLGITNAGYPSGVGTTTATFNILPVIYINSDITLSGEGTEINPYKILTNK